MLLECAKLVKSYNGRCVVDHVSYRVDDGEIVGLLGSNGAGKTTSFRITVGMIQPEAGVVRFLGNDVSHLPMYKRARRGIGYLSQEPSVFQKLTVAENLMAICETMRFNREQRRKMVVFPAPFDPSRPTLSTRPAANVVNTFSTTRAAVGKRPVSCS